MGDLRRKHAVVVAEVGDQDVWKRAGLTAVTVSADRDLAARVLEAVAATLATHGEVELIWQETELIQA